jgi:catalase
MPLSRLSRTGPRMDWPRSRPRKPAQDSFVRTSPEVCLASQARSTPRGRAGTLVRPVVAALAVAGAFACAGAWLSPAGPTQGKMMAAFQTTNDPPVGLRREFAKGVCVIGWFESTGQAEPLPKAAGFKPGRIPLIGRLALIGGGPLPADESATARNMALRFLPPGGENWRTGMNNRPVAAVNPNGVLVARSGAAASADRGTGKADPALMKGVLADHPEVARSLAVDGAGTVSSGFAAATSNGSDAFDFVNAAGKGTAVRWSTVPTQSFAPAGPAVEAGRNGLVDDLAAILPRHPSRQIVTLRAASWPEKDGAWSWPGERKEFDAGLVTIGHAEHEARGPCAAVNADPGALPPGIGDRLPGARAAAYGRSVALQRQRAAAPRPGRAGGSS